MNMNSNEIRGKGLKMTEEGIYITCPSCGTEFLVIGQNTLNSICPTCKGIKTCENCFFNYGNEHNTEYNPEDIVCTYWESDGQTVRDFCSHWKWKGETE